MKLLSQLLAFLLATQFVFPLASPVEKTGEASVAPVSEGGNAPQPETGKYPADGADLEPEEKGRSQNVPNPKKTNPLDNVFLRWHDIPSKIGKGSNKWPIEGFGYYTAEDADDPKNGEAPNPNRYKGVTEEQFASHTRYLAEQVKNDWQSSVDPIQSSRNKDWPKDENGNPKQPATGRLADKGVTMNNGRPKPKEGPMSVGQMTNPNQEGVEYSFRSQGKPNRGFKPGAKGRQVIDTSIQNKADRTPAYQAAKQEHGTVSDSVAQAQAQLDSIRQQSQRPGADKNALNKQEEAAEKAKSEAETKAKEAQDNMQTIKKGCGHSNGEACPEIAYAVAAANAGEQEKLNGVWQVAFRRVGIDGGQRSVWGAQKACLGRGDSIGCSYIQADNRIQDKCEVAKKTQNKKDEATKKAAETEKKTLRAET